VASVAVSPQAQAPDATQPQSSAIRSSLGQRGGVVKRSDGFDLFYGLVGDQPSPQLGGSATVGLPAGASSPPGAAVGSTSLQQTASIRPALGKRGGVVRKSDAFEVFYGLVGDQPSNLGPASPIKEDPRRGSGEEDASPATGQGPPGEAAPESPWASPQRAASEEEAAASTPGPKLAPDPAMFSLATPASSFAPPLGSASSGDRSFGADLIAGDLRSRLTAQMSKSPVAEFSLATPAASFAPARPADRDCAGPEDDSGDVYEEEPGDLQVRLNAVAHVTAEMYSMATPAASLVPSQAIPELDISTVGPAQGFGELGDHRAPAWSLSSARFPDLFSAGRRANGQGGRDSALQTRLDALDGAISRLKALQAS